MAPRKRKKDLVLVVDDEESIRRMLCRFFETQRREAVPASSAKEAVDKIRNGNYVLALVDVNLSKENGIAPAGKLRAMDAHLRISIMSGNEEAKDVANAVGFISFLRKPCIFEDLRELLRKTSR